MNEMVKTAIIAVLFGLLIFLLILASGGTGQTLIWAPIAAVVISFVSDEWYRRRGQSKAKLDDRVS